MICICVKVAKLYTNLKRNRITKKKKREKGNKTILFINAFNCVNSQTGLEPQKITEVNK